MAIESFRGDYYFLSSMCEVPGGIKVAEGIVVPAAEVPYKAAQFEDMDIRRVILASRTGMEAFETAQKYKERGVKVREDWDEIKLDAMRDIVNRKFTQNRRFGQMLLDTGDEEIIEGNSWGDNFWGVSPPGNPEGQNWLGIILMETRQRIRDRQIPTSQTAAS